MEPVVEGSSGGEEWQREYFAEFFFQLPGSQETPVRPVAVTDHAFLAGGEVLPVADQQPPQASTPSRRARPGSCGDVPLGTADLVERVGAHPTT